MEKEFELAKIFRNAINLAYDKNEFFRKCPFDQFPRGCCGDASILLAQFLLNHGVETMYVCGNYYGVDEEKRQSHAWLQLENGIIIDITGDQFKYNKKFLENDVPVYFGRINTFYKLFKIDKRSDIRRSVPLNRFDEDGHSKLLNLYNIILKYIEE